MDQDDNINLEEENTESDNKFFDEELDVISILRGVEELAIEPSPETQIKKKLEDEYYKLDSAGKKIIINEISVSLNNSGKEIPVIIKKVYSNFLKQHKD